MATNNLQQRTGRAHKAAVKWPLCFRTRPYSGGRGPGRRHVETVFAGSVPALCPLCKVPLKNSLEKHLTLGCNALS
jgi:hypothetical protein